MNVIPYVNRPAPLAWDVVTAIFGKDGDGTLLHSFEVGSVFQDDAGTTPGAPSAPLGKIVDQTGNGRNASQPTLAWRPMLMQSGDVWYIQFDYSNSRLPIYLPNAIEGDLVIAGRKGTLIVPVSYATGTTLTIGPDTYTGGVPGILRAVGGVVAVALANRPLTAAERRQVVEFYKSKGAKGLLVPGPELNTGVRNTINGDWTEVGGVVTASGTTANSNVSFNLNKSTVVGRSYLLNIPATLSKGTWFVDLGPGTGASQIGNLGDGTLHAVLLANNATSLVRVGRWTLDTAGAIGPISIRELRAEEDWV